MLYLNVHELVKAINERSKDGNETLSIIIQYINFGANDNVINVKTYNKERNGLIKVAEDIPSSKVNYLLDTIETQLRYEFELANVYVEKSNMTVDEDEMLSDDELEDSYMW